MVAIIGVVDVPLVVMATRWYRGIHPVTPDMEPSMRAALIVSVIGLTSVMALLLVRRRKLIQLESRVRKLQFLAEGA